MAINVLLVDDDELIRSSLGFILDLDSDLSMVGTCQNGDEAVQKVMADSSIDVILMDIRMPICDGVLATKKILQIRPQLKIIILTTFDDDEYIFEALKNGAKGYLLKNVSPEKIIEGIKVVHHGSVLIHQDVAGKLSGMLRKEKQDRLDGYQLAENEKEIIRLISRGLTNQEIAAQMFLSEGTIKNKVSIILDKLGVRDRTQIAIFYLQD